jgi:hypothetical protein
MVPPLDSLHVRHEQDMFLFFDFYFSSNRMRYSQFANEHALRQNIRLPVQCLDTSMPVTIPQCRFKDAGLVFGYVNVVQTGLA